jgi:hypothetical protein
MSWKSISGNQTVSRANLQDAVNTGVFVARNGVPATDTNREVTKANVLDYIYAWELNPALNNKAPNQLPVKSNLAVQSNQVYAAGGEGTSRIFIGNTNRYWLYSIDNPGGDRIGSVASSTDNRCILYGKYYDLGAGGGGAHVSNDYGETFRRLDSVMTTNDACLATAMSSDGELMILTRQVGSFDGDRAKIYFSTNSGATWAIAYNAGGVRYNFNGAAMSGNGGYATVLGSDGTSYYVFRSTSFGSSFTRTYLCQGIKTSITGCVGMSKSGQYQLLTPPEPTGSSLGYFYVSNDYGNSWTAVTIPDIPLAPNDIFKGCSVSAGGDYMTVVAYSLTVGQLRTYISSDWGVNWTIIIGGSLAQAVDSSGQFQYQRGRQSIDYGNTWVNYNLISAANSISVNPTTFTTPYTYGTSTGGNLYKSVDQGSSFSLISISGYFTKVATSGGSNNGKYVAAIKDNDPGGFPNYNLYQSYDYGATWNTILSFGGQVLSCCAVSDDGVYWFAAAYDGPSNGTFIYRSTDSGVTWSYVYAVTGRAGNCAMSNTGQYISMVVNNADRPGLYNSFLASSNDYGLNWAGQAFNNTGRTFVDIAMSGQGRFRTLVSSDSGDGGARISYSTQYGVGFSDVFLLEYFYATSCSMDDSGRVAVVSFTGGQIPLATTSRIYSTTNGWGSINSYNTDIYPGPLLPPTISGVNVSSDGTYWSAVSSNAGGYSFTCTTGDGNFVPNITGITFNNLSK